MCEWVFEILCACTCVCAPLGVVPRRAGYSILLSSSPSPLSLPLSSLSLSRLSLPSPSLFLSLPPPSLARSGATPGPHTSACSEWRYAVARSATALALRRQVWPWRYGVAPLVCAHGPLRRAGRTHKCPCARAPCPCACAHASLLAEYAQKINFVFVHCFVRTKQCTIYHTHAHSQTVTPSHAHPWRTRMQTFANAREVQRH